MRIFKIISLCLCFSVFAFAERGYDVKHEVESIKVNNLLAKKDWYDSEEDIPRLISFLFEKPK